MSFMVCSKYLSWNSREKVFLSILQKIEDFSVGSKTEIHDHSVILDNH